MSPRMDGARVLVAEQPSGARLEQVLYGTAEDERILADLVALMPPDTTWWVRVRPDA